MVCLRANASNCRVISPDVWRRKSISSRLACSGDPVKSCLIEGQFRITEDNAEHIVEIVGHAAGQPPDRFHFLRLHQLAPESFPIRLSFFRAVISRKKPARHLRPSIIMGAALTSA